MAKFLKLAGIAALLGSSGAMAGIDAGLNELSVSGSVRSQTIESDDGFIDSTDETITAAITYNRFITQRWSVGGTAVISLRSPEEGDESGTLFALGRADYYLNPESDFLPYAGASLGLVQTEGQNSDSSYAYGAQVGGKSFISENVSVNGEFNVKIWEFDDISFQDIGVDLGISYYFE